MERLLMQMFCVAVVFNITPCFQARGPVDEKPPIDSAKVPKYLEVTPKLGTGGQPTEDGLRELANEGYKAVINLRTPGEGVDLAAEEKLVRELGLEYFNIPVLSADPKEDQALEFLNLMDRLNDQKVFVHCAAANRVGGFVMIHRVLKNGVPPEKAEEEANQIGLRSDVLRKFAKDFVEHHKK